MKLDTCMNICLPAHVMQHAGAGAVVPGTLSGRCRMLTGSLNTDLRPHTIGCDPDVLGAKLHDADDIAV